MRAGRKIFCCSLMLVLCSYYAAWADGPTEQEIQKMQQAMPTKAPAAPKQPRKLLVFNLCEGYKHGSIPYGAMALEMMGRTTGAFTVVQSEDMAVFQPDSLMQFDAVLFNNTTRLKFADPNLRESLMNFIKSGKGIVGIHAAIDNFYDWPEAAQMMGGLFDLHPWIYKGTWAVKIEDPCHPVVAAFEGKDFKIIDEIYRIKPLNLRQNCRVLMGLDMTDPTNLAVKEIRPTDKDVPISWVRDFGKGRLFFCSLGHNDDLFWFPALLQHYLAGIQFALGDLEVETAPLAFKDRNFADFEDSLAEVAKYEFGQSRQCQTSVDDFIRRSCDSPEMLQKIEGSLLHFLQSDATLAGRQFVCKELSIIGTAQAVPVLEEMLTAEATSDMARYALERIDAGQVNDALLRALDKTTGKVKIGIINSLGERRNAQAVTALAALLGDVDPQIAAAGAEALAKIGGESAEQALAQAAANAPPQLWQILAQARLICADKFQAEGNSKAAYDIYQQMYGDNVPHPIRLAALRGLVLTAPQEEKDNLILQAVKGDNPQIRSVAVGLFREIPDKEITRKLLKVLPGSSPEAQEQLIAAFGDIGDRAALPAVTAAVKSDNEQVRQAALSALAALGEEPAVLLLAGVAATAAGKEQDLARQSLDRLSGPNIDNTIRELIKGQIKADIKTELVRSLGPRQTENAVPLLLQTAKDEDTSVRSESFKVLAELAGEQDLPALIGLLAQAPSTADRSGAEKAVISLGSRMENAGCTKYILEILPTVKEENLNCSLLNIMGKLGNDIALTSLRSALQNSNPEISMAALRALADWPSATPMDDLLKVAGNDSEVTRRVLSLRGYIRMVGLKSDRSAADTTRLLQQVMTMADRLEEKKMILGVLPDYPCPSALALAQSCLQEKDLAAEAENAVKKIEESLKK